MPKFNVDEIKQLAEPIEITLEGKTYVIEKVTTELIKGVDALKEDKGLDVPIKQLAILLGVDSEGLKGIDLRKIGKVLEFITKTVQADLETPKNA